MPRTVRSLVLARGTPSLCCSAPANQCWCEQLPHQRGDESAKKCRCLHADQESRHRESRDQRHLGKPAQQEAIRLCRRVGGLGAANRTCVPSLRQHHRRPAEHRAGGTVTGRSRRSARRNCGSNPGQPCLDEHNQPRCLHLTGPPANGPGTNRPLRDLAPKEGTPAEDRCGRSSVDQAEPVCEAARIIRTGFACFNAFGEEESWEVGRWW